MPSFAYFFEEIPLGSLLVSGAVDVSFSIQPAEPDVGIMRPYAEDLCITNKTILLDCIDSEGETFQKVIHHLDNPSEFSQLEEALWPSLCEAANEWEPDYGD